MLGYHRTINSLTPEELRTIALYERQAENIPRLPPSEGVPVDWKAGNISENFNHLPIQYLIYHSSLSLLTSSYNLG